MGFEPSNVDQDLWIKKSEYYEGYDYIATHVDDIIIVAKILVECMNHIKQYILVRDVPTSPEYYLRNNIAKQM
eukprot:2607566-Ditylum_brightwellii.AAC.1